MKLYNIVVAYLAVVGCASIIAAVWIIAVSWTSISLEDQEFHDWKLKFGKVYQTPKEEAYRKEIWLFTRHRVLAHNIRADQGIETYRMGMNRLSDMTEEEYGRLRCNLPPLNVTMPPHEDTVMTFKRQGPLPPSKDWRRCVTKVEHQGDCGSCWAFSATGALESHICIKSRHLIPLSKQQLVDCSKNGNNGCNGGNPYSAFEYIKGNKGINTEASYPYEARDSTCRFKSTGFDASCQKSKLLRSGTERELQETLATVGPVSVSINSDTYSFKQYKSGVFNDPACSNSAVNHAVLVVGYGTEKGQEYWLVKNSWGVYWGEQGYIKMARNKGNQCCIACYPVYPEVESSQTRGQRAGRRHDSQQ